MAMVSTGYSISQNAPQHIGAPSLPSTGSPPSSAHPLDIHAANASASPPAEGDLISPMVSQLFSTQPTNDERRCRTSSTQSEPAPMAPFIATSNPRSTVWEVYIDLDDASSKDLEEE